jgi:hypothetical protein
MGDVGHVAPDFEDRRHFNTLVVRPQYRITLRIGEIEDLFPDLPNTDAGRMARLQVLGLFYFPLKHKRTPAALPVALDHFAKKILSNASAAQVDAAILGALRTRVISGAGAPPAFDPTGGGTAALPIAAATGATPAAANFGKIRFPGGYTYLNDSSGLDLNRDAKYAFNIEADRFNAESRYYQDNPVLGKIPLIAKVEKREGDSDTFQPAQDVMVYFQLLPPYDPLPAFDATVAPSAQINRPPLRTTTVGPPVVAANAGPAKLTNSEEARHPAPANDPQLNNCHSDRGGKRGKGNINDGSDVAGVIFETASRKGFNAANASRPLPHTPFPVAEKVAPSGVRDAHAVRALTNSDGEAGVIFTPSRTGGDRYRLRAYIGLPSLPDDGTGPEAVRVDTGTLVVWRTIRISRYLQQAAGAPDASLLAEVSGAPYNLANLTAYQQQASIADAAGNVVGFANADFSAMGTPGASYDGVVRQFARAFCETELDASPFPEPVTAADWQAALTQAIADGNKLAKRTGTRFDLNLLFCQQPATPINSANAFSHLPMHTAEAYNALLPAGSPKRMALRASGGAVAAHRDQVRNLFWDVMIEGIQRYFSRDGVLPGLTVIQAAVGCTWQLLPAAVGVENNSGLGENYRAGSLWFGAATFPATPQPPGASFPYDCTSNFCHEMGHLLYREHAPGQDPGNPAGGGPNAARHDRLADSVCVMSYKTCEGQYCAKCLFAFRGWHSDLIP